MIRIAVANLPFPATAEDSVVRARGATEDAAKQGASLVCFPECFVPGYRGPGKKLLQPDAAFLERAWLSIAATARSARVAVVLGTERVVEGGTAVSTLVFGSDGAQLGFQDKVQLDPSEEETYVAGVGRRIFEAAGLKFGIVIWPSSVEPPRTPPISRRSTTRAKDRRRHPRWRAPTARSSPTSLTARPAPWRSTSIPTRRRGCWRFATSPSHRAR